MTEVASRRTCQAQNRFRHGECRCESKQHGHPFGHDAAQQATGRAGARDLSEPALGGARIEPLARHEPESRPEHWTHTGNLQVHDSRCHARGDGDKGPLDQQQEGAGHE